MKVYDKTIQRGIGFINRYAVMFPEIRLMGKWLQECGFEPGQEIDVATETHKLVITISPKSKEEEASPKRSRKKRKDP